MSSPAARSTASPSGPAPAPRRWRVGPRDVIYLTAAGVTGEAWGGERDTTPFDRAFPVPAGTQGVVEYVSRERPGEPHAAVAVVFWMKRHDGRREQDMPVHVTLPADDGLRPAGFRAG